MASFSHSRPAPTAQDIQAAIMRAEVAAMRPGATDEPWAFAAALKWVAGEGIVDDYTDLVEDQEGTERLDAAND
jgi:hypothetical protein